MTDASAPPPEITQEQAEATMRSRQFAVLLVLVAIIGVIVSLAAWCFLELIHQIQQELYTHLPHAFGYPNGPPEWWPLPILGIAGLLVALAISRLPGDGGHLPAKGLAAGGPPRPIDLPGVILAGLATIGSGLILGPEAPLIALGAGVGLVAILRIRKDAPPQLAQLVAAAGSFAAVSFIFQSPLIAAVLLIEAAALGAGRRLLVIVPGLLAAGIGSLVSIGIGSWTGLSTSAYAIGPLSLPTFTRPDIAQFGWTIGLAIVVAIVTWVIMKGGLQTHRVVLRRLLVLLPIVGLIVAGLAIAFNEATGKSVNEVLFSGQDQLPGLISSAGTWSSSALLLLILFKGIGYSLSLGSFRGGPTFPALFLGAAGGILASRLPGYALTPAVAVGMGAAVAAVLRLPLSAVVLATLLTGHAGTGDEPLIIVGVVVAYLVTLLLSAPREAHAPAADTAAPPAAARFRRPASADASPSLPTTPT
jgi:H+/Cl- antiporter ClcA